MKCREENADGDPCPDRKKIVGRASLWSANSAPEASCIQISRLYDFEAGDDQDFAVEAASSDLRVDLLYLVAG